MGETKKEKPIDVRVQYIYPAKSYAKKNLLRCQGKIKFMSGEAR
jgi:hypothetical protein